MATSKVEMKFQGHEKFALREGWINKALLLLPKNSDAFTRKDATDLFGIGSNMVKSLRYWMRALGLTNKNGTELSPIGKLIAENDPYLEKPFSLWLMHSYIAKNIKYATTWYMYFNRCDADDLEKQEIEGILLREIRKYSEGTKFSEKSVSNDIDVLLSMYCKNKEQTDPEDKSVSPFAQLSLVKRFEGKYNKACPSKKTLPELIVLFELSNLLEERDSISIEEAVFGEKGLNKIYNLSSIVANDYLDKLEASGYIRVDRTAGLDMIYPEKELEADKVVLNYYKANK